MRHTGPLAAGGVALAALAAGGAHNRNGGDAVRADLADLADSGVQGRGHQQSPSPIPLRSPSRPGGAPAVAISGAFQQVTGPRTRGPWRSALAALAARGYRPAVPGE